MRIAGVAPLPTRLLSYTAADGELVPAWLSERDRPWLRDLVGDAEAFAGRPVGELALRWQRSEPDPRAGRRWPIAAHVLVHWLRRAAQNPPMSHLRQQVFALAAAGADAAQAFATVARRQQLDAAELARTLYADLPHNRIVRWPDPAPDLSHLMWSANLALARGMLRHAVAAEIKLRGAARTLLKTAWLLGVTPTVSTDAAGTTTATWRRGRNGRATRILGSLLALLPWAERYRLRATCQIGVDRGDLVVGTGDAILPGPEPRLYDSHLERVFANDFRRGMPGWTLLREPAALETEQGLAFPDFELRPPGGATPWLCELAGLRDPGHLPAKLALLTAHDRLVLCLPERAVPDALRGHARVVPFRRRVCIALLRSVIVPPGTAWRGDARDPKS